MICTKAEAELWQIGRSDGLHGTINAELTDASIIYRDGWRHGVLERITKNMNEKEYQQ